MSLLTRMLPRLRSRSRWRVAGIVIATLSVAAALLSAGTISAGSAAAASCGTTNLALHQPTTASSIQGPSWPASNATDGSLTTRWSSAFSDPQWLEVDLGSTQSICQVAIHWETAYAKAFQIQTSNDNSTWTTIYSTTTGTGGTQTLNVIGQRPLYPHVRHRPRHPVRLLHLRIPNLFGHQYRQHGDGDQPGRPDLKGGDRGEPADPGQ